MDARGHKSSIKPPSSPSHKPPPPLLFSYLVITVHNLTGRSLPFIPCDQQCAASPTFSCCRCRSVIVVVTFDVLIFVVVFSLVLQSVALVLLLLTLRLVVESIRIQPCFTLYRLHSRIPDLYLLQTNLFLFSLILV